MKGNTWSYTGTATQHVTEMIVPIVSPTARYRALRNIFGRIAVERIWQTYPVATIQVSAQFFPQAVFPKSPSKWEDLLFESAKL